MKKRNIILVIIATIFLSLALFLKIISISDEASSKVKEISSLIDKQSKIESQLKTEGYTFDKPNVVVNPYGNSPLTALVMFETQKKAMVSVIIKGKDELTTYTHIFNILLILFKLVL